MSELTFLPVNQIYPNPYQHPSKRRFSGDEFNALVESVRADGVQQHPTARPHPTVAGAVQLQDGHRRFAAHRVARPDEPFAVVVEPLTDVQMFEGGVIGNSFREDYNDIERAELIEQYKQLRPEATNADLARVFRLKDPASVSNLRKLNKLPDAIKQHVAANAIPQAVARQLVGIAALNEKTAVKIANEVAAAPKAEKQETFEDRASDLFWKHTIPLDDAEWDENWLADAPIVSADKTLADGGEYILGPCAGCPFLIGENRCARKACFEEKWKLFAALEAERVATAMSLLLAAAGEKVLPACDTGEYGAEHTINKLLHARKDVRALLRLAPAQKPSRNWIEKRVFGSRAVMLGTVDKRAVDAYLAEVAASERNRGKLVKEDKPQEETPAQAKARLERERKEMEHKRAERSAAWKNYFDAVWLIEHAADLVAGQLVASVRGPFVAFIEQEFLSHYHTYTLLGDIEESLDAQVAAELKAEHFYEVDKLRLKKVALAVFSEHAHNGYAKFAQNEHEFEYEKARDVILTFCTPWDKRKDKRYAEQDETFGIELPKGWDEPPVHKTECNCWYCGKFAGNQQPKLTQRDIKEDGWIDEGEKGVFCSSEHQAAYQRKNADSTRSTVKKAKAKK